MSVDPEQRQAIERIAFAALLVVLAFTLFGALKNLGVIHAPQAASGPPPAASAPAGPLKPMQAVQAMWDQQEQAVSAPAPASTAAPAANYTAGNLRDPLQSLLPTPQPAAVSPPAEVVEQPAEEAPSLPPLVRQGLWWGGAQISAIINGEVYRVGDHLDGATIVAIDQEGVTVEQHGTTTKVPFASEHTDATTPSGGSVSKRPSASSVRPSGTTRQLSATRSF